MKQLIALAFGLLISISSFAADPLWIDVRSEAEHRMDNIQGDLNISYEELSGSIMEYSADKNRPINLYCRSGRRAEVAKNALEKLGYTKVTNYRTISEARKARKKK